jgi:two-component system, CitB family, response regulator CitT
MLKIAIVEDDFRVADIHEKFLLKIADVQVVGKVRSGNEAIAIMKREKVDLVLLDIYMPDSLGTDLIWVMKQLNPTIGIIIISAATEKPMVETSIFSGVFDYIIKPVKMERFIAAVERFQEMKTGLSAKQEFEQTFLDNYFGYKNAQIISQKSTPKGIDPLTLEKVKGILSFHPFGIAADGIGEKMGASRTTARRYVEYLISIGEAKAELEYGIVGRPERKYYLTS